VKTNDHISIEEAKVVAKNSDFHTRKFSETIEIEQTTNKINRDDRWKISTLLVVGFMLFPLSLSPPCFFRNIIYFQGYIWLCFNQGEG